MLEQVHVTAGEATLGRLLTEIIEDSTTDFSISWYDTARVVSLWSRQPEGMPPDLARRAVARLLTGQNADGSWGYPAAPVAYRLVPTLGVVHALAAIGGPQAAAAAARGVAFLGQHIADFHPARQPDTVAVELILPDLLESLRAAGLNDLDAALELQLSQLERLHQLRRQSRAATHLPLPLWHSLEVLGPIAAPTPEVPGGAVACSPSATAAALATAARPAPEAVRFLTAEAERYAGGWPTVTRVRFFEGAWVVCAMAQGGARIEPGLAHRLRTWLTSALRPQGAIPGTGLPPDADDTACVLYALGYLGERPDIGLLRSYERDGHFATFQVERTPSISTNAHVLRTVRAYGDTADPFADRAARVAYGYLADTQNADGFWDDKWHASPYYATSAVMLALAGDPTSSAATRATRWLLDTQRPDGSWGVWHGTFEETAYAVRALLAAGTPATGPALRRGAAYLVAGREAGFPADGRAPLWHGKVLYEPRRIALGFAHAALHACAQAGVLGSGAVPLPRKHEESCNA
ncbi:hypothetical protein HC031_13135 [Planosporangium thailandense]|uniref:Squalene cyclase C-terminal domain-containing protein n=1 Tax=Planosporangium thailandense TaxID=765197 RepID=A0ABX0XX69_9ACTN|nr:prenyltransferase/squalene oxidase repeat-containing protein [Planosporangium thailandense]NJC70649.1 hypothetical protein [Planosporangium thailandense]